MSRFVRRPGPEAGMVTVELALGILVVAGVAVVIAWVLAVLGLLVQCQDTAAEVARQAARNDTAAVARATGDRPPDSTVEVRRDGRAVRVEVRLSARPWAGWLPSVPLTATASVLAEESW